MAEAPVESVTLMTKGADVPTVVGVPTIATVFVLLAAKDKPAGRAPLATDQLKGATPPVAVTTPSYAPLILPDGRDIVTISGAGSIVIFRVADWVGYVTEVAVTPTVVADATLGGAVYVVEVVVDPAKLPVVGLRDQVTPAPELSFSTWAEIGRIPPPPTVTDPLGVSMTE